MLSGKQAFNGETVSETLAAVIKDEPDWSKLPATTPPRVRELVRRCLTKEPRQRLRDIGDARIAVEETLTTPAATERIDEPLPSQPAPRSAGRQALPWALAAISVFVLLAVIISNALRVPSPPARPTARLVVTLPPGDRLSLGVTPAVALSPDGSRLVYVADRGGSTQLYLRAIDRLEATPIASTEGAQTPFFSPDGESVGFFADGKLKKVGLSGGAPLTLCSSVTNRGATWAPDDTIIFTPSYSSGLFRVSAAGGTPRPLTVPDRKKGEVSHRWPQILPGGKVVLFTTYFGTSFDEARIRVLSLETGEQRVLVEGATSARYVPSGHLVYARAGGLLAVPFDLRRLEVTGPPVSVLEGVSMDPITGAAQFSASADGLLTYIPGGVSVLDRTLLWVDRKGRAQPLPVPPRAYVHPRLSPDGRRLAVGILGPNQGVWIYDLERGTLTKLTETKQRSFLVWTPDAKRVTFVSPLGGTYHLFWMPADGSGAAERLTTSENPQFPGSWSPDGQMFAFSELDPTTGFDIWVLRLEGDRKPQILLQTPAHEYEPMFSPDGRWLAYVSNETGRAEIYVRPFPGPGAKWQISTEGGAEPV